MSELLFDDIFKVENIDPDGKKYDKVSRIVARSEKRDMYMLLDVNTEIYPMEKKERFLMALSPSLVLNTKDGSVSIHEKFEYIMHGRLYDITNEGSESRLEVSPGSELSNKWRNPGTLAFHLENPLILLPPSSSPHSSPSLSSSSFSSPSESSPFPTLPAATCLNPTISPPLLGTRSTGNHSVISLIRSKIDDEDDGKGEQWVEVISWEPRAFVYHNFLGGICFIWRTSANAERSCFPLCQVCNRSEVVFTNEEG